MNQRVIFKFGTYTAVIVVDEILSVEDKRGVDQIVIMNRYGASVQIETDENNEYDGPVNDALLGTVHDDMLNDLTSPLRKNTNVIWAYEASKDGMRWSRSVVNP